MKILFTFENPLPSIQADAEVFVTTAAYLAPLVSQAWLHVPLPRGADVDAVGRLAAIPVVRAWAPVRSAWLRHLCCGLTLVFRRAFRDADLVYTRNLWIAWMALLGGQKVAFDHYRPWPDQIPPLRRWIHRLICHRHFLVNICHSEYTRGKYLDLGVPAEKLVCVRNGFEPQRLRFPVALGPAKQAIGVDTDTKTVVYTGRLNHRKGLDLVIEAARRLPDLLFILVGSSGPGPIEAKASGIANIRIVGWQPAATLGDYIFAADVLLIPPSVKPLAEFGSTVLPLKLFLYMASNRPILAGDTPDVREVLGHERNALLCRPDCLPSLVADLGRLTGDAALSERLAATALADSRDLTWDARADKIAIILGRRLRSAPAAHVGWSPAQRGTWMRQSWRWLVHLVRERSWVLPPEILPRAHLPAAEGR